MAEKCPLSSGEHRIGNIPTECLHNCYLIWDEANRVQVGEQDWYGVEDYEDCKHGQKSIEHSHEALFKQNETADRQYVIVDQCAGCEAELMETTYTFECPHN
jgi:hypothetical protein